MRRTLVCVFCQCSWLLTGSGQCLAGQTERGREGEKEVWVRTGHLSLPPSCGLTNPSLPVAYTLISTAATTAISLTNQLADRPRSLWCELCDEVQSLNCVTLS